MHAHIWKRRIEELEIAVAFLTRLPVRFATAHERSTLADAAWSFPLVGVLVGGLGATVYVASLAVGLVPWLGATLAILAQILLIGGLHEDGLADSADSLGGRDRARRLEIMRDSRIGSYGVLALILSLSIRIGGVAAIGDPWTGAAILVLAAALSRAAMALAMRLLAPARSDGLGADAGRAAWRSILTGWLIACVIGLPPLGLEVVGLVAIATVLGACMTIELARRRLGGQTGDVLGAIQQVAECICLLVCSAAV